MDTLLADIVWVPDERLQDHWIRAHRALGKIDEKDVPYLACALSTHCDAIWSFDKDFDKQRLVPRIVHPTSLEK